MNQYDRSDQKRKDFAEFLKALCKERYIPLDNVSSRGVIPWTLGRSPRDTWDADYLAQVSGIKLRTIRAILEGKLVKLEPHLAPLAQAFGLNELQKEDFWAIAGYLYEPEAPPEIALENLAQHIEAKGYPTTFRTGLWDFLFINPLHAALHGMNSDVIRVLSENPLGPNLLLVLFDPQFQYTPTSHRLPGWDVLAICSFRRSAFRYKSTDRYYSILNHMQQFPAFCEAWEKSYEDELVRNLRENFLWSFSVHHATFGLMRFSSYRVPLEYASRHVFTVYVPLGDSVLNYLQFRETVQHRRSIRFAQRPLYHQVS